MSISSGWLIELSSSIWSVNPLLAWPLFQRLSLYSINHQRHCWLAVCKTIAFWRRRLVWDFWWLIVFLVFFGWIFSRFGSSHFESLQIHLKYRTACIHLNYYTSGLCKLFESEHLLSTRNLPSLSCLTSHFKAAFALLALLGCGHGRATNSAICLTRVRFRLSCSSKAIL